MRNDKAKVSNPNEFITNSGEKYHVTYAAKVMPDGIISLKESGKKDIKQYINSFRYQTDMSFILSKLANGDKSVLNQKNPMFGNFTQMPKSYAESLQLVIDAKKHFYEMPVEVRNKFDNSYEKWFVTAGSDSWIEKMGYNVKVEAEAEKVEDGVSDA